MVLRAVTREVSRSIQECALTYRGREEIDYERARAQHSMYVEALRGVGVDVLSLPPVDDLPDAVFVEDTAVVVEEVAVMTRPALPSRQPEVDSVAAALAPFRSVSPLPAGGTLEGGDVVRIARTLFVGLSSRTNDAGIDGLCSLLHPHGYSVVPVPISGCLHLKTACTYVGRNTLLANPQWVDTTLFGDVSVIEVEEADSGNALAIGDAVIFSASYPRTREKLQRAGFDVVSVDASELEKAEAGVTCCSIVFSAP